MEAQLTAIDVVRNILGTENVVVEADSNDLDKTLVRRGEDPAFSNGKWTRFNLEGGFSDEYSSPYIELTCLDKSDGHSLAAAAHEASHALLWHRHRDDTYRNEGLTNRLAGEWLNRNLSCFKLHTAREMITLSNISYGHN